MTDEQIQEIEARADAATDGPWVPQCFAICGPKDIVAYIDNYDQDDLEFIAAARIDVPELIAEIRQLRGIIEDLETENEELRRYAEDAYSHGYRMAGVKGTGWLL